jgi:hypothetical protein
MNRRPILELDDPLAPRAAAVGPTGLDVDASRDDREPTESTQKDQTHPHARRSRPKPVPMAHSQNEKSASPELALVGEESTSSGADGAWRHWAGGTRVASYRLPDELLEELDARARRLGVPIGMTVAAGLLQLFDQDDETIIGLVERAEDARVLGRRAARRRA